MTYYTYTYKNHAGIYYFRIKIPAELRSHFNNKCEIRKSLKTRLRGEAIRKAQELASVYQERFRTGNTKKQIGHIRAIAQTPVEVFEAIQKDHKAPDGSLKRKPPIGTSG